MATYNMEDLHTVAQVAKKKNVSLSAVRSMIYQGRLDTIQVGATMVIWNHKVESWDPRPYRDLRRESNGNGA